MRITETETRAHLRRRGAGVLLAAQVWRRRNPYDFAGKSVVITGGSRGLGLVLARELADRSARLTLVARDEEELQRAVEDLETRHRSPKFFRARRRARALSGRTRHRDGLRTVRRRRRADQQRRHHPGRPARSHEARRLRRRDVDAFLGTALHDGGRAAAHAPRGAGRIVNISSIGGKIGVPHLVPYSASKFALAGLSEGLRSELARDNITVTTVFPGLMRTGSPVNAMFKGQRPQEYAWFAISDSLPLASITPERAARQIIRACRYGDAELDHHHPGQDGGARTHRGARAVRRHDGAHQSAAAGTVDVRWG